MPGRIKTELSSARPNHGAAVAGRRLATFMSFCSTCGRQDTLYHDDHEVTAARADASMHGQGWTGIGTGAYDAWQCPRCDGFLAQIPESLTVEYGYGNGRMVTQPRLLTTREVERPASDALL
jgi:hypothetical protein